jgi:hypothetical protein
MHDKDGNLHAWQLLLNAKYGFLHFLHMYGGCESHCRQLRTLHDEFITHSLLEFRIFGS